MAWSKDTQNCILLNYAKLVPKSFCQLIIPANDYEVVSTVIDAANNDTRATLGKHLSVSLHLPVMNSVVTHLVVALFAICVSCLYIFSLSLGICLQFSSSKLDFSEYKVLVVVNASSPLAFVKKFLTVCCS